LSIPIHRTLRHKIVVCATELLVSTAALVAAPGIAAQTYPPVPNIGPGTTTPHPTLKVSAQLVVLDVVVTDKTGEPVDGLTTRDFQVFESGSMQRIRSVEPPSSHILPLASGSAVASVVYDPARPGNLGQSPVNILVLDQLNTHFADSSFARRCLHDYLASQPALLAQPTTLLRIDDSSFRQLQTLTRDRGSLLNALAAAPTQYPWTLEVNGKTDHGPIQRLDQSLRALEEISQSYARIPGRKNLIWVGGGFPSLDPEALDGSDLQEVKDTLRHVTNVLLDTRVTVYAVDPASTTPGMTEITDASQMAFVQAAGDSVGTNVDPFNSSQDFDKLGPLTGGRVVHGMNDIARQIASSVDLGSSYYTISYTPDSDSEAIAKFRKIHVVCLRPGLTANTRSGYYAGQTEQEKAAAAAAYDLTTAAEGVMPLNGIHVTAERDSSPSALPAKYIVHAGVDRLTWRPRSDGSATASVYVMAVSLNAKDKMIGHTMRAMAATAKPETDLRNTVRTADFYFTASPAPRSATLRFIVRDSVSGRMGSVDLPLPKH